VFSLFWWGTNLWRKTLHDFYKILKKITLLVFRFICLLAFTDNGVFKRPGIQKKILPPRPPIPSSRAKRDVDVQQADDDTDTLTTSNATADNDVANDVRKLSSSLRSPLLYNMILRLS